MRTTAQHYIALCNERQRAVLELESGRTAMWMGRRWRIDVDYHEVCLSPADESHAQASKECEVILGHLKFVALTR